MKRLGFAAVAILLVFMVCGCTSFERTTFQTLAANQSVINLARQDYRTGKLPQSKCVYALINDATAADTVAVDAMVVYEQEKAAKGDLTAQQAIVGADLVALAPLVVEVQALYTNPCKGGA